MISRYLFRGSRSAASFTTPWALGRLATATTPEAGALAYTYSDYGLALTRTDARNVQASYQYDAVNRLTGISYTLNGGAWSVMPNVCTPSGGTAANVCFAYGSSASSFNNGRMTQMTDPTGTEIYSYDALGRTLQLTKAVGGVTYPISYGYDLAGDLKQITYPSGRVVQQSLDSLGRLSQVSSGGKNYVSSIAYNSAWEPTGFSYGNGVQATFGYNSRMQLQSLAYAKSGANLFSVTYGYTQNGGNNGQITSITDNVDGTRSTTMAYDAWNRIKSWSNAQATLAYTYDRYGNRLTQSMPVPESIAVDPSTNHVTTAGYAYDAAGNMTQDNLNVLSYDGENRVVSSNQSGTTYTYAYDGNGLRVEKTPPAGSATVYIFSGSKVIAEYAAGAAAGSPSTEYIYSGAQLAATITGGTTTYQHPDHLSTRVSTDTAGNTARTFGHYPFGEVWYETGTASKWKFTTYERDAESDNDYAMARLYRPRLGRFLSPDPLLGSLANPQSLNRYAYSENEPANFIDPSGLTIVWGACFETEGPKVCEAFDGSGGVVVNRITQNPPVEFGGGGIPGGVPPPLNLGPAPQPPPPPGYEQCIIGALEEVVKAGEGTSGPNGYGLLVGGRYIDPNTLHAFPNIAVQTRYGISHAYGAYQFMPGTWTFFGGGSDVSPSAQDDVAASMLNYYDAVQPAMQGNLQQAFWNMFQWASMPDAPGGQRQISMQKAVDVFNDALTYLPECQ